MCSRSSAEIGDWISLNGESIYGTRPWKVYGEGPATEAVGRSGICNENKIEYTAKDIRFTTKGNVLYAIVLGLPHEMIKIKSLAGEKIAGVTLLGNDRKLDWSQVPDALEIQPITKWPCKHAVVFRVQLVKKTTEPGRERNTR